MEFFKANTQIDFMGLRKVSATLSILMFIVSLASLAFNGLHWGLDFTGGTQLQVSYQQPANLEDIRHRLDKAGFPEAVVQSYGNARDVLISLGTHNVSQQELMQKIVQLLPGSHFVQGEFIGAQVGSELATKGALAMLLALLGTMAYIAFRFEYRFAIGAAVGLIHDPVLILGIFSFFHLEFNLTVVAGMLAVLGYSLNDTIVIFDRVRENFRKIRKGSPLEIMNLSINQTLSRTIMTSAMTLVVVSALYLFGPEMIHNFALALVIGIIVGTYSSIYVSGALAVALGLTKKDLIKHSVKLVDETP